MKTLSLLISILLCGALSAQTVTTDTNVQIPQRNSANGNTPRNVLGSENTYKALGFNGSGVLGALSISDMLANTSAVAVVQTDYGRKTVVTASVDTDAARGTALIAAVAAMAAGDTLVLAPGTFDIGTTQLVMPAGSSLIGQGWATTIINGDKRTNNIKVATGVTIDGIKLMVLTPSSSSGHSLIGNESAAYSNVTIRDCHLVGEQDIFNGWGAFNNTSIRLVGCRLETKFDVFNHQPGTGNTIEIDSCWVTADGSTNPDGSAGLSGLTTVAGCTATVRNTRVDVGLAPSGGAGSAFVATGGTMNVIDCWATVATGSPAGYDLYQAGAGVVHVTGGRGSGTSGAYTTFGTISYRSGLSLWDLTPTTGRTALKFLRVNATNNGLEWAEGGGSGSGNVTGPASAVDDRIATFNGTTGSAIDDGGYTIAGVLSTAAAAAAAAHQPLDSDLTSISALTTTSFGRGLLDDADASAGRTSLGVVIGSQVQAYNLNTSLLGQEIALSEMGDLAQNTMIGRYTASTGDPEAITIGGDFSVSGGTLSLAESYQPDDVRLTELTNGALSFQLDLDGGYTVGGPVEAPLPTMSGTNMSLSEYGETYASTADATLAFSGTPATGQIYTLNITADNAGPHVITLPSVYSINGGGSITSVTVPANGSVYLTMRREASRWVVFGDPVSTTGSGDYVLRTSPVIETPTISGAITFPDGVRQAFNPNGTNAGVNVGSQAGDPSSPSNGDLWYDSTANELTARINGANVALGAGGGGGLASTDIDTSSELRAILTDETGTGNAVFSASPTFSGTVTMDTLSVTTLGAGALEFEGATADAFETTITVTDSTADRTWTIPNTTDTFVGLSSTQTMTGKTLVMGSNTITGASSDLRTTLSDETGTGAAVFAGGDIGAATATTPSENDNDISVATTAYVQTEIAGLGGGGASISTFKQNPFLWDEYMQQGSYNTTYNAISPFGWKSTLSSGASATGQASSLTSSFGLAQLATGATGTPAAGLGSLSTAIIFNATQAASYNYETRVITGSSISNCEIRIGFIDSVTSTEPTDGVYFRYQSSVDPSWICVCRSNGSETSSTVDSAVDVATSTAYVLRITVNAAGNSAGFYINGTSVGSTPITSNIPGGSSTRQTGLGYSVYSTEAVNKELNIDYTGLEISFSSAR